MNYVMVFLYGKIYVIEYICINIDAKSQGICLVS